MSNDEIPLFRPKLGGKVRQEKAPSFKRSVLAKASKSGSGRSNKGARGGHVNRGMRAQFVRKPKSFSRRVVIKSRVVKMNEYGRKAFQLHVKYIERDGVEKDGSRGELYGQENGFSRDEFVREIEGEPHQFRFILSPENADQVDLKKFTREFMEQVQKDLGREIEWAAVNHYNTDNPHTHLVVRGLGKKGQELRIDREYISHGMRHRAQEMMTRELGHRSELEVHQQLTKEITQDRYTSLDFKLSQMEQGGFINLSNKTSGFDHYVAQKRLQERLDHLRQLGLAEYDSFEVWRVEEEWQDKLKELGKVGDIIATMHRDIKGDSSRYKIYEQDQDNVVLGRVHQKGLADELYDRHYVIVEDLNHRFHYVDVGRNPDQFQSIKEGRIYEVKTKQESWVKPSDHHISKIAEKHGGQYSRELHLSSIHEAEFEVNDKLVKKEDFVDAILLRAERLESMGFIQRVDEDTWSIPKDMISELSKLDQEKPIRKLVTQQQSPLSINDQIAYRGRTWLDRFTQVDGLREFSNQGLGQEVKEAVRERQSFLKSISVDPDDPQRARKLDSIEQNDLIKEIEKAGVTYRKPVSGERLQGRLTKTQELGSGKVYAVIHDDVNKRFGLAPWRRQYDKLLKQKAVQLSMGRGNRLEITGMKRGMSR